MISGKELETYFRCVVLTIVVVCLAVGTVLGYLLKGCMS